MTTAAMRHGILTTAAFLGLSMILPAAADAATALKVNGRIYVRTGPGTKYRAVRRLTVGQVYVGYKRSGKWWKVYYNGTSRWLNGNYLKKMSGQTGVKVTTTALNVRTGPSTRYRILGQIRSGQIYWWGKYSGGWYRIWWGGRTAWIHGGYVRRVALSGGTSTSSTRTYGSKPSGDASVARLVYNEAVRRGVREFVKIALFEACVVESGMRNLNYGDRDSLGVLQLRWRLHGWTTATSPTLSTRWFLNRAIPRQYSYSTAGRLAQAVQVSAYPYRYDQAYSQAKRWLYYLRGW